MGEVRTKAPAVRTIRRHWRASTLRSTLGRYYAARRKLWAEDQPDFYDGDLRRIFSATPAGRGTAATFMRKRRPALVASVSRWTGQRKYVVDALSRKLAERCENLALHVPGDEAYLALEVGAYVASLVANHLHTGRFKRSV